MVEKEPLAILVIDDDEDDYFIARRLLEKTTEIDAELEWAREYDEGLEKLLHGTYDIALVDYRLGAHTGLELLREAVAYGTATPIILLTGQGDREVDLQAMAAGAADYLIKWEFDAPLLERAIRYARERKRAEERIREQAALLDKARDAISAFDLDGHVIYWNKSAERLTGYSAEEMMDQRLEGRLFDEDDARLAEIKRSVMEKGEWSGELRQTAHDGGEIIVESRWTLVRDGAGNPRSILVINTDVTERKQLESQFLRAQRMESIGRLVSGIAHDLGNLLVPILLGVKVLQQRYGDDEKTVRTLGMMQQSGQRGSDMVKQVLAFARGVQGERVPLPLDQVIREVERMADETFPGTITLETEIEESLSLVLGDATQLQQVVMNLCVNARDAMPDGGRLRIEATQITVDERMAKRQLDAEPGDYVRLSVSDTGTGIPPDVVDKIFEPFFTTKPVGKGTGLGLSTVYSIIKSHGGFATVESVEGEGTTFHIYLPVCEESAPEEADDADAAARIGAGELVLVVDDEDFIRETAQQVLEAGGYRVVTAAHGKEALRIYEEHGSNIAAVITDLMMPEMDGIAMIRALRKHDDNLPIIAASGMAADGEAQEALDAGAHVFLSKPFTAEKLYGALGDLLPHGVEG